MARRALLVFGGGVVSVVLLMLFSAAALLATAPGHGVVRDLVVRALQKAVNGRVTIGSVSGNLLRAAELSDVTIETKEGAPVIRAERVNVRFALGDLLRSRYRLSGVVVVHPIVVLEQGTDGRWNVERLFGGAPSTKGPTRRPFVELAGARVVDGTVIVREHKAEDRVVEREVHGLNTELARLRLSHPDSTAIEATFRSLAARVTNPNLDVSRADGVAALDGDSLRFSFRNVVLPHTAAAARGRVRWGKGHPWLEASVNARRFAFEDVHSLVPIPLPRTGGGRVSVRLRLGPGPLNEFDVTEADITTGRSHVAGRVVLTLGEQRGARLRGLDATLQPFELALLRLYQDTLPVKGLVRGRVHADGPLRDLQVSADVAWADEAVPGAPVNTVGGRGRLALGGHDEVTFEAFTVQRSDVALGTIRHFAPSVDLPGRLRASGVLDGPWKDASFRGSLAHVDEADGELLGSAASGSVRLGLADTVRISADLDVDSVSLDLLRRRYPAIPLTGALAGRLAVHGPITALAVDARLKGDAGAFTAQGTVGQRGPNVAVALTGTMDSLDVSSAVMSLPPSALGGHWEADLLVPRDDPTGATGTARVTLGSGVVSGVAVSAAAFGLSLEPARVSLDTARVEFVGGTARATGGLGRGSGLPAHIDFDVRADTAAYLEPLLRWWRASTGDSVGVRLDGAAGVTGRLDGMTRDWRLELSARVRGVRLGDEAGRGLVLTGRMDGGNRGQRLSATLVADTIAAAGFAYGPIGISATGRLDSLALKATAGFHVSSALKASLTVARDGAGQRVRLDSLDLDLPVRRWHLVRGARVALGDSSVRVDNLELRPVTGAGVVRMSGVLPRATPALFDLVADSVPVADVYALLQRDTAGVSGAVSGSLHVAGLADNPIIEVHGLLSDAQFGDYRLPLFRVAANYANRRLALEGGVWRDSVRLLTLTGSLPLDLALHGVPKRQLPGAIDITARADSLDMAVLDPLTVIVTDLSGIMSLDVRIGGTWDQPSLGGNVDIWNGVLRVPALGARYTGIDARLTLENDVVSVARAVLQGAGGGRLDIGGQVRFESLTRPVLDLTLTANRFAAFDIRSFGALTATGALALKGPAIGATLSGRVDVDAGSLQFKDLVEKRVVSLDDPEFRALVDTNLSRAAELGPKVHTVFLDSLRVQGLTVALGNDVWLRSSEANIQLDGDFEVVRGFAGGLPRYRLDGTLHAVRGTYRLTLGKENSFLAISRDFRVSRGTVRFFGTPEFNPELDIAAEHVVRTAQGTQLTVRALIGGTLRFPELRLESDARPPLSETEIVSYLMFGQPPASLGQAGAGSRGEAALAQAVGSSLVGGVGQALASELGLSLDYLTIVPGAARPGSTAGVGTARLEAGAQLGERTFLTLNAGLCEVLASQLVGATLEYRLTGRFTASAAFEPVIQECGTSAGLAGVATSRKQFGFDLFWQQGIR